MKQLTNSFKRVKAGTSKAAAAVRRKAFAQAYIANGRNGTEAAITAGFSPKGAHVAAIRLLRDVTVSAQIDELTDKYSAAAGLTVERTLREVARLSYFDARELYREDGRLKAIHELDADTRAAIASIEMDETGRPTKIKLWDKNAALEKACKHLGLFDKDNSQQRERLVLSVEMAKP